ncbi:MAG TPA: hypothetical protein VE224_04650 [Pseudolabrys sp.]|jgi:hypothetical protein|nr:hypothetical protein [Pseudolabrys sp.]
MRYVLAAAAALAVGGFFVSGSPASAQTASPPYVAGGPMQVGGWCMKDTDDRGDSSFGYFEPCSGQALASAPRYKRHKRR